jgi:hypothetical protein
MARPGPGVQIVETRRSEMKLGGHGMNISATRLDFDESMMWVDLSDGRKLGVPLAYFPRLLRATPEQRLQYEMSGNGSGLHWDALDEDISVEGLLMGIGDQMQGHSLAA